MSLITENDILHPEEGQSVRTQDAEFALANAITVATADATRDLSVGTPNTITDQVTPITAELLDWWFHEDNIATRDDIGQPNFHPGQRDAIIAVIYAHEVLGTTSLSDIYDRLVPGWLHNEMLHQTIDTNEISDPSNRHPKYAIKMATGTGKTWVLNALLIWQYLNALAAPNDRQFTKNFLIVAPGLIVYDRLLDSFKGKPADAGVSAPANGADAELQRDYRTSDIFSNEALFIPDRHRERVHAFMQGAVVEKAEIGRRTTPNGIIAITNWHLLAGKDKDAKDFLPDDEADVVADGLDPDAKAAAASILPLTPGIASGNSLDTLDRRAGRGTEFEWLRDLPDLLVFNDEAHHIHKVKRDGVIEPVEWQRALDEIGASKGDQFTQIDFTATPYGEKSVRGGGTRKVYFPHIVVDFDLRAAIKYGLVKSIALDKRSEIASVATEDLDFRTEVDDDGNRRVSDGQAIMLSAGLRKLAILEEDFAKVDESKHPKLLVLTENTEASKAIEAHLLSQGIPAEEMLRIDSDKKGDMKPDEWAAVKRQLAGLDRLKNPRIVISVLMLREGFDVNSICVIVPLRASQSKILLEQVVGRGLRLMWRGNSDIDAMKAENRRLIREGLAPTTRFDLLSIIEHPAYEGWYVDELGAGQVGEDPDTPTDGTTGDIEVVELRDDYERFDFEIPFVIRDADEELDEPSVDVASLAQSKYPFADLKKQVGRGEHFTEHDALEGTTLGEYVVDAGVFTAASYSEYLARIAAHIDDVMGRAQKITGERSKRHSVFPVLQIARPVLIGMIDRYVRTRLFGQRFNPLEDENWRLLLLSGMPEEVAGVFVPALIEQLDRTTTADAVVDYRHLSEARSLTASAARLIEARKCIYPKLRIPPRGKGGGLERDFVEWADQTGPIEAYCKIDEHKHEWLQRPYLKDTGYPARYSPDFLVRTASDVYVVETKAQSSLSDENVKRKQRAALAWVERINALPLEQRGEKDWHYALIGEDLFHRYRSQNGGLVALMEFASLHSAADQASTLF